MTLSLFWLILGVERALEAIEPTQTLLPDAERAGLFGRRSGGRQSGGAKAAGGETRQSGEAKAAGGETKREAKKEARKAAAEQSVLYPSTDPTASGQWALRYDAKKMPDSFGMQKLEWSSNLRPDALNLAVEFEGVMPLHYVRHGHSLWNQNEGVGALAANAVGSAYYVDSPLVPHGVDDAFMLARTLVMCASEPLRKEYLKRLAEWNYNPAVLEEHLKALPADTVPANLVRDAVVLGELVFKDLLARGADVEEHVAGRVSEMIGKDQLSKEFAETHAADELLLRAPVAGSPLYRAFDTAAIGAMLVRAAMVGWRGGEVGELRAHVIIDVQETSANADATTSYLHPDDRASAAECGVPGDGHAANCAVGGHQESAPAVGNRLAGIRGWLDQREMSADVAMRPELSEDEAGVWAARLVLFLDRLKEEAAAHPAERAALRMSLQKGAAWALEADYTGAAPTANLHWDEDFESVLVASKPPQLEMCPLVLEPLHYGKDKKVGSPRRSDLKRALQEVYELGMAGVAPGAEGHPVLLGAHSLAFMDLALNFGVGGGNELKALKFAATGTSGTASTKVAALLEQPQQLTPWTKKKLHNGAMARLYVAKFTASAHGMSGERVPLYYLLTDLAEGEAAHLVKHPKVATGRANGVVLFAGEAPPVKVAYEDYLNVIADDTRRRAMYARADPLTVVLNRFRELQEVEGMRSALTRLEAEVGKLEAATPGATVAVEMIKAGFVPNVYNGMPTYPVYNPSTATKAEIKEETDEHTIWRAAYDAYGAIGPQREDFPQPAAVALKEHRHCTKRVALLTANMDRQHPSNAKGHSAKYKGPSLQTSDAELQGFAQLLLEELGPQGGVAVLCEQEAMVEKGVPSLATLIADRGGERMQVVPGTLQETKGKIKGNQIATRMEVISVAAEGAAEDEQWAVETVGPFDKANLGAQQGGVKGFFSKVAKKTIGKALAGKALLVEGITVRQVDRHAYGQGKANCDAVRVVVGCGHWPTEPSLSMAREVLTTMQKQVAYFGEMSARLAKRQVGRSSTVSTVQLQVVMSDFNLRLGADALATFAAEAAAPDGTATDERREALRALYKGHDPADATYLKKGHMKGTVAAGILDRFLVKAHETATLVSDVATPFRSGQDGSPSNHPMLHRSDHVPILETWEIHTGRSFRRRAVRQPGRKRRPQVGEQGSGEA